MATIIWCDHVRHIVKESRTEVEHRIENPGECEDDLPGANLVPLRRFVYFTPVDGSGQRALNVAMVSSFEAMPGDGI